MCCLHNIRIMQHGFWWYSRDYGLRIDSRFHEFSPDYAACSCRSIRPVSLQCIAPVFSLRTPFTQDSNGLSRPSATLICGCLLKASVLLVHGPAIVYFGRVATFQNGFVHGAGSRAEGSANQRCMKGIKKGCLLAINTCQFPTCLLSSIIILRSRGVT